MKTALPLAFVTVLAVTASACGTETAGTSDVRRDPQRCIVSRIDDRPWMARALGLSPPSSTPIAAETTACESAGDEAAAVTRRILPIVFVPRGENVSDDEAAAVEATLAASLQDVQTWYRAELARQGVQATVNIDLPIRIDGYEKRQAYGCDAAGCDERLPLRVADELARHGYGGVPADRVALLVVRGAGAFAQSLVRQDGRGALIVFGDDLLRIPAPACQGANCIAERNRVLAHAVGHGLGLPHTESGAGTLMDEATPRPKRRKGVQRYALVAGPVLDATQVRTLRESTLLTRGLLDSGRITLSRDEALVTDVAFDAEATPKAALVVWGKPLGPKSDRGYSRDAIGARLVRLDTGVLGPEVQLSAPPMSNPEGLGDREASIVYDAARRLFLVAWSRQVYAGGAAQHRVVLADVNPETGEKVGEEATFAAPGLTELVETDLAYATVSRKAMIAWAATTDTINANGTPLYVAPIEGRGMHVPAEGAFLDDNAKYPSIAYDHERDRFLVTWTHFERGGIGSNEIRAQFVGVDGIPQGAVIVVKNPAFDAMMSEAAYDPVTDRFVVSFWMNDEGSNWDVHVQPIDAVTGELPTAQHIVVASGPAPWQYDPAITYSAPRRSFLVSWGDDPGNGDSTGFFDGLGNVKSRWMTSCGRFASEPLDFSWWRGYDAYFRTETAAHPTADLAAVAWSGVDGIHVQLLQSGNGPPAMCATDCDGDPGNGCTPPDAAGSCGDYVRAVMMVDARLYDCLRPQIDEYRRRAERRRGFGIALQVVPRLDDMPHAKVREHLKVQRRVYPSLEGVLVVGNVKLPTFYKSRNDHPEVRILPRYLEDLDATFDKFYTDGATDPPCTGQPDEVQCVYGGPLVVPPHDFDIVRRGHAPGPELWAAFMPVGYADGNTHDRYGDQLRPYLDKVVRYYRGEIRANGRLYMVGNDEGEDFPSLWKAWGNDGIDFYGKAGPNGETGPQCLQSGANVCYVRWPLEQFGSVEDFLAAHASSPFVGEGWQQDTIFLDHVTRTTFDALDVTVFGSPTTSLVTAAQARSMVNGGLLVGLFNSGAAALNQPGSPSVSTGAVSADENIATAFLYGSSHALAVMGNPFPRGHFHNHPTVYRTLKDGSFLGHAHFTRMKVNYERAGTSDLEFRQQGMEMLLGDPFMDLETQ